MKKFNLFNEIVVVDKNALLSAFNSARSFGITYLGEVLYEPFEPRPILIYRGQMIPEPVSALSPRKPKSIAELLGSDYKVVEDDDRVLIKAGGAWQRIIGFNQEFADYDDTSGDGIAEFSDKELETIGWHATEFEIGYRDIVDLIEAECEGILLCIEQDEPYRFSGLGYIFEHACAREHAFEYCRKRIERMMAEDPHYAPGTLTDDESEAAEFFKAAAAS